MNLHDDFWDRAGGADVDALSALEKMRPGLRRARQRRRLAVASGAVVLLLPLVVGFGMLRGSGGTGGGTEVVTATVPDIGSPAPSLTSSTTNVTGELGTATSGTSPATVPGPDAGSNPDTGVSGEGELGDGGSTTSVVGSTTTAAGGGTPPGTGSDPAPGTSTPTTATSTSTTSPGSTTTGPGSSTSTTSTTIPPTTTTVDDTHQRTFTAASGGSVTVSWDSGGMALISVDPAAGYTSKIEGQSATEIQVEFESATAKTDVVITFDNGQPNASYSYEVEGGDGGDGGEEEGD
ncbi:MAG TPA: hypothetical protein ENI86_03265 [Acidimicrobiales bacterium]|nr:hypothetical protein [Acidimicrobiales bacterium]